MIMKVISELNLSPNPSVVFVICFCGEIEQNLHGEGNQRMIGSYPKIPKWTWIFNGTEAFEYDKWSTGCDHIKDYK